MDICKLALGEQPTGTSGKELTEIRKQKVKSGIKKLEGVEGVNGTSVIIQH